MNYGEWATKCRELSIEKYAKVYSATNENKEVRVHNIGNQVFFRFFIDGIEIEEPEFPGEVAMRFRNYLSKFHFQYITKEMLISLADTIAREFLPHLKDPRQGNFNDWELVVHIEEE